MQKEILIAYSKHQAYITENFQSVDMKLKHSLKIIFFLIKFLCLIPFSLNLKTPKIKFSFKSILWCVIFSSILILVDPYLENIAYKLCFYLKKTGKVQTIQSKGTHSMVLVCVYWTIFNIKFIFDKLNKFQDDFNEHLIWKQFLIKFLTCEIFLLIIHFIYYILFCNGSVLGILFCTPITILKYMVATAMLIKFNVFLIFLRIGFSKINCTINKNLTKRRNHIGKNNKMSLDCEISDTMDELAAIHFKLCEASHSTQLFNTFVSLTFETKNGILGIPCLLAWGFADDACNQIFPIIN